MKELAWKGIQKENDRQAREISRTERDKHKWTDSLLTYQSPLCPEW